MPFSLIALVLSVAFVLVWAFVGLMLLRMGQMSARRDADSAKTDTPPEVRPKRDTRRSQAA